MVSLLSLSQRRAPVIIAIMAILMLFIAPEVSKTLAKWRAANSADVQHGGMSHDASMAHGMAMPGMMAMSHEAAQPHHANTANENHHKHQGTGDSNTPQHPAGTMQATLDDLACGYCELLVHFPLIVWLFVPLIWLLFTSSVAPPTRPVLHFPAPFFPGSCLPRAPPAC